jgi:hypothetical protein
VISGCEVSGSTVNPGLVAFVWDSGGQRYAKVVPFAGASGIGIWPQYLYLEETAVTREYQSGGVKNIAIDSKAAMTSTIPAFPYVRILAGGPEKTFRDVIQTSSYRLVTDSQIANWNDKPTLAAFTGHTGDNIVHITNGERASWNDKVSNGTFNALAGKAWTSDNSGTTNTDWSVRTLFFNESGVRSWNIKALSANLNIWAGDLGGNVLINNAPVFHAGNLNRSDVDFFAKDIQIQKLKVVKSTPPNSISQVNNYISVGAGEYATGSYRLIGFGFCGGGTYQPAYIGFVETTDAGATQGDLIFGTRGDITDSVPTERMRIKSNGDVTINGKDVWHYGNLVDPVSFTINRTAKYIQAPGYDFQIYSGDGNHYFAINYAGGLFYDNQNIWHAGNLNLYNVDFSARSLFVSADINQNSQAPVMDINPYSSLRFGRSTNSATFDVVIFKGDGSFTMQNQFIGNGNTYLNVATGNLGVGRSSADYKVHVEGSIVGTNVGSGSDRRWKKQIKPFTGVLDKLIQMQMVSFRWKDKNKDQRLNIGYVSQEVEPLFPELVLKDAKGYMSLEYPKFGVLAIEGLKELRNDVYDELAFLRKELAELRSLLNK